MKQDLQFVADAVMAQEVIIAMLVNALTKHHPEITTEIIGGLDTVLKNSPIPTRGARAKISGFRDALAAIQPSLEAKH